MKVDVARRAARRIHAGQTDRFGEPLIDHVARVARAVPQGVRALAYLHDVLESTNGAANELRALKPTDDERAVLELLTRGRGESYRSYVIRVADADGLVGRTARTIKLADLEDHLRRPRRRGSAPQYGWARRKIAAAQRARGEAQRERSGNPTSMGSSRWPAMNAT